MSQRSPKFFLREKIIAEVINERSLKRTWKAKTHTDFRSFPITDPVDFLDIQSRIDDICKKIVTQIRSGEYTVSRVKRFLIEKSRGLCRQMTIPSVEDALTLQCLADAFWHEIKSKAPSKNAFFEPKDHSFSKNEDDEPEYGSVKSWLDFQKKILGFSDENKFIIITDVANYYDFIDFSHLRNVIVSTVNIKEPVVDFLMYMLSGMCWRPDYMPTREVGMPQIDIDAPRLLAHCFLFELDAVVEDLKFSNYARFMDDIDAGANNIAEAKNIIKSIDLTLQTRQLRLNSGKTKIMTNKEARKHFRALENRLLKIAEGLGKTQPQKVADFLAKIAHRWNKRHVFDEGNGEKIFKRILTLAIKFRANVERKLVYDAIRLRPNIRGAAFRYLSHVGFTVSDLETINRIISDGHVCDDSFYLEYGRALAVARVAGSPEMIAKISETIDAIVSDDFYRLYTAFTLGSRFLKADKLLDMMKTYESTWRHDYHLGRIIGGFSPIARRDKQYTIFAQAVKSSLNIDAISVMDFHYRTRTEKIIEPQLLNKFIKADSSFPCGVRLGKWMVLHSILQNENVPQQKMAKIRGTFAHLKAEPLFSVPGL